MTFAIGADHALAQLAATIAFADQGSLASRICIYTTAQPAPGADPGGAAQAEIVLAKPCGTIAGGALTLHVADSAGTMVLATGLPRWGRWVSGTGALVADGTVTDAASGGDFTVAGAETPAGETSPMLYAGGLVLLGAVTLT